MRPCAAARRCRLRGPALQPRVAENVRLVKVRFSARSALNLVKKNVHNFFYIMDNEMNFTPNFFLYLTVPAA